MKERVIEMRMRVVHHLRSSLPGQVSIERLFQSIRDASRSDVSYIVSKCRYKNVGVIPRIRNISQARGVDGHVHHVVGDSHYLVLGLPPKRTILTIHDTASLHRLTGIKRSVFKLLWFTLPIMRAREVTTISDFTKQELVRLVGPEAEKVKVIPNCLCIRNKPSQQPFNSDAPRVLHVGTAENKNLLRTAEAIKGTGGVLRIIGLVPDVLKERLTRIPISLEFLGRLSDREVEREYQNCDIVVFASLYEGFGLPILEGQASGKPVITSDLPPMRDVAGEGALLVDPMDVSSIRQALKRVIRDANLRESLVHLGRENLVAFEPQSIAEKYEALYRKVAASSNSMGLQS